jgi:hypothetical protein
MQLVVNAQIKQLDEDVADLCDQVSFYSFDKKYKKNCQKSEIRLKIH